MKIKPQSKMKVILVSAFFQLHSFTLPGLGRPALAGDQPAQSEQVIEVFSETTNTGIQLPEDQKVESEVPEDLQPPVVTEEVKDQEQESTVQSDGYPNKSGQTVKIVLGLALVTVIVAISCLPHVLLATGGRLCGDFFATMLKMKKSRTPEIERRDDPPENAKENEPIID